MRLSEVLAASLAAASLAVAHGVPGMPKIFGLPARDIAGLKARSIFGGHNVHRAVHASQLKARQGGQDGRCGKSFGCATCAEGYCCSPGGYCGQGDEYCMAPDSQFDYGPGADANKVPAGGSTRNIARPKLGDVLYGGDGIYSCVKPGQLAMTYDDGPYIYTNDVLDMFKSYNFQATFFVTGINNGKGAIDDESTQWPGMIRRMVNEGHQLASHTWSHQDLSAITKEQRYDQMVRNEMAMSNIVGKFPTYMRPPYSSCSEQSGCEKDMEDLGYHVAYFDLDTDDYNNLTPDKAQIPKDNVKRALDAANSATDDFLAIGHDIHYQTVHNLTVYMLDLMVKKGYKGVTMGECLGDPEANWYRSGSGRVATSSSFTAPACASTAASSSVASNVSASTTSSGATATATGLTTDGTCGTINGLSCTGFADGECCSQYGHCGRSAGHCGDSCQKGYGKCGSQVSSGSSGTAAPSAMPSAGISQDGSCGGTKGYTCTGFSDGECCSQYGYCGTGEGYCGTGCNALFGKCGSTSSANSTTSPAASTAASSAASSGVSSAASSGASSTTSSGASSAISSTPIASSQIASSTPGSASSTPAASSKALSSTPGAASSTSASTFSQRSSSTPVVVSSQPASSATKVASSTPVVASSKAVSSSAAISTSNPSPSSPGTPGSPPTPGTPGTPGAPGTPPSPPSPGTPGTPPSPGTPGTLPGPSGPSGPGTPPTPGTPGAPSTPPSTTPKPSSTTSSSSRVVSSTSAAQPTGERTLFGTCGPQAGTHCLGYILGECCSGLGFCGSGIFFCGSRCQRAYGKCN